MHRALVISEADSDSGDVVLAVARACGFETVRVEAWPDEEATQPWSLIVHDLSAKYAVASNRKDARYRVWLPWAGISPASTDTSALVLSAPMNVVDLAVLLLAFGFQPVTDLELGAMAGTLYQLAGQDETFAVELVDSMITTNEGDLLALRQALGSGQWAQVSSMAHRLKSTARMLGCHGLVEVCANLESLARAGETSTALALVALISPALNMAHQHLRAVLAARHVPCELRCGSHR